MDIFMVKDNKAIGEQSSRKHAYIILTLLNPTFI